MTREEAIHILNNLKPTDAKSSFDAYVVGKAITMAIKALEQEPKIALEVKDMIIHRPHRGGLNEAMKEARQFTSLGECINTLIQEHNNSCSFQVSESDIYLIPYGLNGDDRIGWKDTFMICCAPYSLVKDKCGYELYYGGRYEHPLQLFGFVSTSYLKGRK